MKSGLTKTHNDRRDYSLHATFGSVMPSTTSLPDTFSIYDGRPIPDQDSSDIRFTPALLPLPYGCTGETQSFLCGLEDGTLYNPEFTYNQTPPSIPNTGRDIRAALQETIDTGLEDSQGNVGFKRVAYFSCEPAGAIDWTDAVRLALFINQNEKRGVSIGSYWYPEFATPIDGIIQSPSFNTSYATLHNHLITGWKTINGVIHLEDISWQGMSYGNNGLVYFPSPIFNALMAQPYCAAFTLTKVGTAQPIPIGASAWIAEVIDFVRSLFHV